MPPSPDHSANDREPVARPGRGWWVSQLLLTAIAGFFLFFGISLLAAAYRLGDPYSFIMTFFAASLIILISLTMVIGFILRMWRFAQRAHPTDDEP